MSAVNPCGVPGGTSANTLADWQMTYHSIATDAIGAPASWNQISNPTSSMSLADWQCAVTQGLSIGPWDDEQIADAQAGFNAVTDCWPCEGSPTGGGFTGACLPGTSWWPQCQGQQVILPSVASRMVQVSQTTGVPVDPQTAAAAKAYSSTPMGSQYPGAVFPYGGGTVGTTPAASTVGVGVSQAIPVSTGSGGTAPAPTSTAPVTSTTTTGSVTGDLSTLVTDLTSNPIYLVLAAVAAYFIFV